MAVNTTTYIATLEARHTTILTQIAALPGLHVQSAQGRSLSSVESARESLLKELDWVQQQLAALGAPVGTIGMPFEVPAVTRV